MVLSTLKKGKNKIDKKKFKRFKIKVTVKSEINPNKHLCILVLAPFLVPYYLHKFSAVVQIMHFGYYLGAFALNLVLTAPFTF